MTKKIISIFIILAMILTAIPLTISASEPDTVYISISDDSQFVTDSNGTPMAFYPVTLDELAEIDLSDYYLDGYAYDADGDNVPELTALHLYIYVHEIILGLDWSDVNVSGSAGSIYFAGGLFGFSDENLRYDLNGAYPAVDGWGLTADQIVLNNGDFLNIAHYTSWAFWGDSTTGFHYFTDSQGNLNHTYNTSVNEELELGLVRSYSDWMNGGAAAFDPETGYTVYYGTAYGVPTGSTATDDNGLINISFPSGGTWHVWIDGGYGMENPADIVSAPAFAKVIVRGEPDIYFNVDLTECPETDFDGIVLGADLEDEDNLFLDESTITAGEKSTFSFVKGDYDQYIVDICTPVDDETIIGWNVNGTDYLMADAEANDYYWDFGDDSGVGYTFGVGENSEWNDFYLILGLDDVYNGVGTWDIKPVILSNEAEPIDVNVTIVDKGNIIVPDETITVVDRDKSGDFNVDEVLYAAHEEFYAGGAQAGYGSAYGDFGFYITELWGDLSGNFGYWLNDDGCWSLEDIVEEGDYVVAFIYQNTYTWDVYSKFAETDYETIQEVDTVISLERSDYDEEWNTIYKPHAGATIKLYNEDFEEISADAYSVIDNADGTYSVKVKNAGVYKVVAYDNATPIVPNICYLTVEENPELAYANAVEEKIDAIGTVTIYNYKKIYAAREAYNALTDSQKSFVENYSVLEAAERAFDTLLAVASAADHKSIYEATGAYINSLGTPSVGSTGGEWMVIDLTRSGYDCPEGYYENVVDYVNENINDKEQLHRAKSTDNSRVILALTSAGYDVTDVDGHNLLMGLTDMTYLKKQGINGPIWALIAFDCHGYEIPVNADATEQATREKIIAYILEKQLEDGGWALSGKVADPDMTGMAIQSLAPYYETNTEVKAAIDKAIICLSEKQYDNGGFGSIDGICSESCAQVIVALTALGINPETDPRFVKNGVSVVDAMCLFAVEGGGFAHIPDAGINGMATEQAQYALASYFRFLDGKTSLYDMSDVDIYTKDEKAADAVEAMISAIGTVTSENKDAIEEARAAYDALTDEQKALVENYDALASAETALAKIENDIKAADDVEAMISAIGTVTAESKGAIEEARAAYDALTDEQKALVENYDTLTSAETEYSELIAEKELSFFEKLINWIVNAFNWIITLFKNIFSF